MKNLLLIIGLILSGMVYGQPESIVEMSYLDSIPDPWAGLYIDRMQIDPDDLKNSDTIEWDYLALKTRIDSLLMVPDTISMDYYVFDLLEQYKAQLGTYKVSVPCACWPCAADCYEIFKEEPDYYDFERWCNEKMKK